MSRMEGIKDEFRKSPMNNEYHLIVLEGERDLDDVEVLNVEHIEESTIEEIKQKLDIQS